MTAQRRALLLDLDGPILECRSRHYACYTDVCRERGLRPLEPEEYWKRKRRRAPADELFGERGTTEGGAAALHAWIRSIEEPRYLALDTVHAGAYEALSSWSRQGMRLFLATLRRNGNALYRQLDALGLRAFFERVVICDPNLGGEGKAAAIASRAPGIDPQASVWIGDTEADAAAAVKLGCGQLYLVTCGIRDEPYLRSLRVGEVVDDLAAVRARLETPST